MEANACLGCRFGAVKIDVTVPQKYDTQKLADKTRAFTSSLAALTGKKPIHYALKFNSEQPRLALDFTVNCSCILNVKKTDCSNYNPSKTCRIKHLHTNKVPAEVTQRLC